MLNPSRLLNPSIVNPSGNILPVSPAQFRLAGEFPGDADKRRQSTEPPRTMTIRSTKT